MDTNEKIQQILNAQQLTVKQVYRDGPRYWVGRVQRGDADLVLKTVIDDTAWVSPDSHKVFRPSDQLRAEMSVLRGLEAAKDELAGNVQTVVASSEAEENTWMLRTFDAGVGMAAGNSPFVYRPEFFVDDVREAVLDYIESFQRLTPTLRACLPDMPHALQTTLAAKMTAVDLASPSELLTPFAATVTAYLEARRELHDTSRDTLSHGQTFPPHIYLNDGRVSMIDWENASLNNSMQDYVMLWIRGFDNPGWQYSFVERLAERGILGSDDDHEIWRMEVLLQAAGNLNYLHWSRSEPAELQTRAIASLRRQIEDVLAKA